MPAILAIIAGLVPLIVKGGSFLIDLFIKNKEQKEKALADFFTIVNARVADTQKTISLRQSQKSQDDALSKIEQQEDAANAEKKENP